MFGNVHIFFWIQRKFVYLYIFHPIGILNDVIVVRSFDFDGVLIDQDLFDFCHIFWRLYITVMKTEEGRGALIFLELWTCS